MRSSADVAPRRRAGVPRCSRSARVARAGRERCSLPPLPVPAAPRAREPRGACSPSSLLGPATRTRRLARPRRARRARDGHARRAGDRSSPRRRARRLGRRWPRCALARTAFSRRRLVGRPAPPRTCWRSSRPRACCSARRAAVARSRSPCCARARLRARRRAPRPSPALPLPLAVACSVVGRGGGDGAAPVGRRRLPRERDAVRAARSRCRTRRCRRRAGCGGRRRATRVLDAHPDPDGLWRVSAEDLLGIRGSVPRAPRACSPASSSAAGASAWRRGDAAGRSRPPRTSSRCAAPQLRGLDREHFWALALNTKNQLLG